MSTLKLFLTILFILIANLTPFSPLLLIDNDDSREVIEQPATTPEPIVSSEPLENEVKMSGFLTIELDGYCTFDIPQSHWQVITSSEQTNSVSKYLKYKDGRTRMLVGYVTDIPKGTDIPGYIVQSIAGVDITTNSKYEKEYSSGKWMIVPSVEPIADMKVIVYYKLGKEDTSAVWMKVTQDPSVDIKEYEEVMTSILDNESTYYIGKTIFDVPTTGIYTDNPDKPDGNPDEYKENDEDNTIFQDRGGFVTGVDITSNWKDLEIIIDGVKYSLPSNLQTFLDNGYTIYDSFKTEDYSVGKLASEKCKVKNSNGTVLNLYFLNEDKNNNKKLIDCSVVGIEVDNTTFLDIEESAGLDNHMLILPMGITWDIYTDDLIHCYGNCYKTNYNNNTYQVKFVHENKEMLFLIGKLKGIQSVKMCINN